MQVFSHVIYYNYENNNGGCMYMKRKEVTAIVLSFLLIVLFSLPVYAGTWTEHEDHTWTYINDDGESVTGWIDDNNNRYYLDKDGNKKIGWFKTKGSWYYFDKDGVLATNTWIDNYYVNSDGKWKGTR